jgi:hypothetical protein
VRILSGKRDTIGFIAFLALCLAASGIGGALTDRE